VPHSGFVRVGILLALLLPSLFAAPRPVVILIALRPLRREAYPRPKNLSSGSLLRSHPACPHAGREFRLYSSELFVAQRPPQIPTRHGTKRTPPFAQPLDVAAPPVHRRDGSLKTDVAERQHIGIAKDHDTEHRNRPRADALDGCQGLLPTGTRSDLGENFIRPPHDVRATLGSPLRKANRAKASWVGHCPR
jgi:hypothetical protein